MIPFLLSRVSTQLTKHRLKDQLRSGTLLVTGDQWPIFLFQGYRYDVDDPWNGLLRSSLLVSVRFACFGLIALDHPLLAFPPGVQTHIHIS